MALKKLLTKEQYDKLSDGVKEAYIADGEGYKLDDIEGSEDTAALKRAKDREAQRAKEAETELTELKKKLDSISNEDARKRGDIDTLEKSWSDKLEKMKTDYEGTIGKFKEHTTKTLVDKVANDIAHKISTSPNLILPHIKARLKADFDGDLPVTRVLDATGNVSASTLTELETEFKTNKDFSAIIIASKANGGAGGKNGNPSGRARENSNNDTTDLTKMSAKDLVAFLDNGSPNTDE